ncbi:unnamed protein product [Peniophora sp. CBMAI 1063]|nr:unnamed protein product [Peniophora sp. CBMAI 1063]
MPLQALVHGPGVRCIATDVARLVMRRWYPKMPALHRVVYPLLPPTCRCTCDAIRKHDFVVRASLDARSRTYKNASPFAQTIQSCSPSLLGEALIRCGKPASRSRLFIASCGEPPPPLSLRPLHSLRVEVRTVVSYLRRRLYASCTNDPSLFTTPIRSSVSMA